MNIFYLDESPFRAARYHCDKHVLKMIIEYAQLMSTAHRILDPDLNHDDKYKATHINHPCAKWVRDNTANYSYVNALWLTLGEEYTWRYGKRHKTLVGKETQLSVFPTNLCRSSSITPLPQCMPEQYKQDDPVQAYRAYYRGEKSKFATWKNREAPKWF